MNTPEGRSSTGRVDTKAGIVRNRMMPASAGWRGARLNLKVRIMNDFCSVMESCLRLWAAKFHDHVIRNLCSMIPHDGRDPERCDIETGT